MKNIHKILLLIVALTGCQKVSEQLEKASDGLEYVAGKRPPKNAIHEPVYCYKTWADINCYDTPQKGAEARLVGHFEPPPPPPPPPTPISASSVEQGTPAVAAAPVYEIKVNDLSGSNTESPPPLKKSSVAPIKPLTSR